MNPDNLKLEIAKAAKRIAPAWPLKNSVAVNPFLGMSEIPFQDSAKILFERSGIQINMPLSFYLDRFEHKELQAVDIHLALSKNKKQLSVENFLDEVQIMDAEKLTYKGFTVKTVTDLSSELTGQLWNDLMVDKISAWASSYYDEYQAIWNTTHPQENLYEAWKRDAQVDLSAELMGIKNFRSILKGLPDNHLDAASLVIDKLGLTEEILETYLHTLLLKTVGWSSFISGEDWNNALYGGSDSNLTSFLSILLAWELCLFESFKVNGLENVWNAHKGAILINKEAKKTDNLLDARIILQDAYDFACERQLKEKIDRNKKQSKAAERPKVQAVFCIDVRSEVYRRNLETVDSEIETIGFAGFFGFPIKYVPLTHSEGKHQCPVLIPSSPVVKEKFSANEKAKKTRTIKHQVDKTWRAFKSGAISSFSFVSPIGLFYLPKLVSDSYGLSRPTNDPNKDGLDKFIKNGRELDLSEIPLTDKIDMAASAITAMGLKGRMAPLVLITGHGSTSLNNPHASGLDCGACGGHSGEINAMTAEKILNDTQVRRGLLQKGIRIPEDTHFIAAKHDTTTDVIHVVGETNIPDIHATAFNHLKNALRRASDTARLERASRFDIKNKDVNNSIFKRSKDWSQTRPEWGLSGCNSFVIAPRNRTAGVDLQGKTFLHSYNWEADEEFKILETIMTAPMVVTSWINLQYYASTTDNDRLGSGNKTLHNVTGGVGVLEGSAGDLRIGLPFQSIHDGKEYQHLPQRLNVVIEAPIEAIMQVLKNHPSVKALCDNSWITLLHMDENGKINNRYIGDSKWKSELTQNQMEKIEEDALA